MVRLTGRRAALLLLLLSTARALAMDLPCAEVPAVERALSGAVTPSFLAVSAPAAQPRATSGSCRIQLSDYLVPAVRRFADRALAWSGPNCWSTSLYLRGLRPHLIYSHDAEFNWYMATSGACRKLADTETPEPGDIGAIRERSNARQGYDELHAFIFLTSGVSLSKQAYDAAAPIELTSPDKYLNQFGGRSTETACSAPACQTWTAYYRCPISIADSNVTGDAGILGYIHSFSFDLADEWLAGPSALDVRSFEARYFPRVEQGYKLMRLSNGDFDRESFAWHRFESLLYQFSSMQSKN